MCVDWNAVSAIATTVAVLVALAANWGARKQLKSALEIQEQSKSVGLLGKRIELAEQIRFNKSVPEWTLRVLFDNDVDIIGHYTAWQNYSTEAEKAQAEIIGLSAKVKFFEDQVVREHPEIESRRVKATNNAEAEKQATLQFIEKFIADSIKSLDEKHKERHTKYKRG